MDEVVWAKLRYCPYWPAKIVEPPPELKKRARKFCVYFFGSENYGFVDIDSTLSYLEHRTKYVKKGRGQKFKEAVDKCDHYIANPNDSELDQSSVQNQIMVAKEYDFLIKTEPEDEWYINETVPLQSNAQNCSNCAALQKENDKLTMNFDNQAQQMFELEQTIKQMKSLHEMEVEELELKLKQPVSKRTPLKENNSIEYEVESILAHKNQRGKQGQQLFLVKWKGYDDKHNSWIPLQDLNCKKLLREYMKTM